MKTKMMKMLILVCVIAGLYTALTLSASAESYGNLTYSISNNTISITGCDSSTTMLEIPETIDGYPVKRITASAFKNCVALTEVTIPSAMVAIYNDAFRGCTGLTKVNISNVKMWCEMEFGNTYSNPLYYAKHLYVKGDLVTELTIPETVSTIPAYAFYNCVDIESVVIEGKITAIYDQAFANCSSLKKNRYTRHSDYYRFMGI